jgi:hypothetical protein
MPDTSACSMAMIEFEKGGVFGMQAREQWHKRAHEALAERNAHRACDLRVACVTDE